MFLDRSQTQRSAEPWMNKSGRCGQNIFRSQARGALSHLGVALGCGSSAMPPVGDSGMTNHTKLLCAAAGAAFAAAVATSPAQALTAQECSAKYQAAKTAGTLSGQKW